MPKVELKQPIVDEISKSIKDAKSAMIVQYLGLTVEQDTALRKELREAGVTYKVCKNTLMKRAFEGTDFAQLDQHLEGPNALAVSVQDPIAPAKIFAKYAKNYKVFNIVGGVVDGQYYDADQIAVLATVPSREVLLGRLLGSFMAPVSSFARVIKQIAEKQAEGGAAEAVPAEAAAEAPAAEAPAAE